MKWVVQHIRLENSQTGTIIKSMGRNGDTCRAGKQQTIVVATPIGLPASWAKLFGRIRPTTPFDVFVLVDPRGQLEGY